MSKMRPVSFLSAAMAALGVLALNTVTALAASPAGFVLRNGGNSTGTG